MAEQSALDRFTDPDDVSGGIRDFISGLRGTIRSYLRDFGIDVEWWGEEPTEDLVGDDDIYALQYVVAYSKGALGERYNFAENHKPMNEGSPSPEIQFKTGIYVVGEPTGELESRIRGVDNPRLRNLFNTGPYAGYLDGFQFTERREYVQSERVSARDVAQKGYGLGVPWFEVEAYDDDGTIQGLADGYFDPFETETETVEVDHGGEPEQEVWRVQTALNRSRSAGGQWDVGPDGDTPARERARNASGKDVYLGPFHIGTITQRGTVWLRREYDSGGRYTDKATITEQSGIPPQALQKGAKLYKYRETNDAVYLSTTQPPTGFDPTEAGEMDPSDVAAGREVREITRVLLDDDEPTTFHVQRDENTGRLLGLYSPPVTREIESGHDPVIR